MEGKDVTLISTGAILKTTVDAALELSRQGISAEVLSMHTLKPIDETAILSAAQATGIILTIEEHSCIGGLGGAVAEILCEKSSTNVSFKRIGLPSEFIKHVGDQDYLRGIYGLSVDGIVANALNLLKGKGKEKNGSRAKPIRRLRRLHGLMAGKRRKK